MPTLNLANFNVVCAVSGGFVLAFGLVSYLCKERLFLSESCVAFGPHATNWIRPLDYANGSDLDLSYITLYFCRLVLGVQLVIAGVQLPSKYLLKEWRSLAYLLIPGMIGMWTCGSLLIFALVPGIPFVHAMAIAACVTPTDPVLSNTIVKGKFADKNISKELQRIIVAESGANDGLGYPFLFLPLYLIRYTTYGGEPGGAGTAVGLWFGETMGYEIVLGIAYGALVGWIAQEALHFAEKKEFIDRESFLVFAITLALFIVGTCGMIGSDDVLACFIAGNTFTMDDWFRLQTIDDSIQPTIDMLLNVAIFIWFGAVCPWRMFLLNDIIPISRLIGLGILILLLRRLPVILAMHSRIHQIEGFRHALFVGFFGPIGVSAIFYLYVSLEFLDRITTSDGEIRPDARRLGETMTIVIWFLAICSIVIHGLSVPVGKVGYHLPRTISSAVMSRDTDSPEPFRIQSPSESDDGGRARLRFRARDSGLPSNHAPAESSAIRRIGGTAIPLRDVSNISINNVADLDMRPERREAMAIKIATPEKQSVNGKT